MAVKSAHAIYIDDISYVTDAVAEAGKLMVLKSSQPSGAAVGEGINDEAPVAEAVTGTPASGTVVLGFIFDDVVDIDETQFHRNFQKTQQVIGEPVRIIKDGWFLTNQVVGTPSAGDDAYIGADSKFSASQTNSIPSVGKFLTAKDSDGYAKVYVKLA